MSDPFRSDLLAAQTRIEGLESENLRLRAGLHDDAMRKTQRATRIAIVAAVAALLAVVGLAPALVDARAEAERLRAQVAEQNLELGRDRAARISIEQGNATRRATPASTRGVALGCFVDSGDARPGTSGRDLDRRVFVMPGLTPQACVDRCASEGFHFAGVQFTNQCFCGDSYGRFGKAPIEECNAVCAGDAQQRCGGTWRNTVYAIDN
ncbi:MAG TPA: WSC domain-containing protein [Labilithrix sp.]